MSIANWVSPRATYISDNNRDASSLTAVWRARVASLRDDIATDPANEVGGAMAQAMVTIISAFAQLERDQLSERTQAGMAAATANGRKAGRREITTDHERSREHMS
ncbi:recombinase family protein [Arthrobacter sp. Rue61a]|uniref:recombinase family protein n=1 Tax=Arthrobacter sp. Rue61a TaxID=1118963 RepID=UPI002570DF54|nr:recombinase family protein [Arthrobacter sp. Rue61a]